MEWAEYIKEIDRAWDTLTREDLEARFLELDGAVKADHGPDSWVYGAMQNELGGFYRGQGRYAEAETCFRRAMALFEAHLGKSDPAYATALNNLAGTHRLAGRPELAEEEFGRCLALYRETVGTDHILYASGLNNLSLVCLDRGEAARAAQLQRQALEILKGLPDRRDELAASLINLGALCQRLGRLEEAEEHLSEAIRMLREELGTNTPHYHAALNGLGAVHCAQGRYDRAEDDFTQAAQTAQAMFGPDHWEVKAAREHAALARTSRQEQEGRP